MWSRIRIAAVALLLYPVTGSACEWAERSKCMDDIGQLVNYRSEAIEYAFGNVFAGLPGSIEIRFVATTMSATSPMPDASPMT
jgi:hypothetical protein